MEEQTSALLSQRLEARLERVHTWLPAKIVSFDPEKLRATVQPTINKVMGPDGKETKLPFPLLFLVPVDCIKTEYFLIRPPYAKDDPVTVGFYERSVEEILEDLELRDPYFTRKHHLKDAIVVQGRMTEKEGKKKPAPKCWADELIILNREKTGSCIRMLPGGDIVVQVDASAVIYLGPGRVCCKPDEVAKDGATLGTRHKAWADAHIHLDPQGGFTSAPTVKCPDVSTHVLVGE